MKTPISKSPQLLTPTKSATKPMNTNHSSHKSSEQEKQGLTTKFRSLFRREPKTTEDMVAIIDAASDNEIIDTDARRIIEGALEVSEKQTREVMIPRTQMVLLDSTASFSENLRKIIDTGHSRYPVTGESIDDIQGILLTKDLLPILLETANSETEDVKLQDKIMNLLRPAIVVPETKKLNILLRQFRQDRNHLALVVDEYGSVAGLVTIEDVLEEIVGDIEDEHDHSEDQLIRKISNAKFLVNALTPLDDFNRYFDCEIDNDEFDTIGGFVTNLFGHLPRRLEKIEHDNFHFEVAQSDSRRLRMLRLTRLDASSESEETSA